MGLRKVRMNKGQKLGLLGILLLAIGASMFVVLPYTQVGREAVGASFGFYLFAVGGLLFVVGVIWAWAVAFAGGTRAWDEARQPLFCPTCGRRYTAEQGPTCPVDRTALRNRA